MTTTPNQTTREEKSVLAKRLERSVVRGEEYAGTMSAAKSVKVRPSDWHAICAQARALSAALQSPTDREGDRLEWRPIESAPDNELVWCFEPHDEGGFIFAGMQQRGRRGWYNNLDFCDQNPTHWRPLPEAPAHLSRSIVGEGE